MTGPKVQVGSWHETLTSVSGLPKPHRTTRRTVSVPRVVVLKMWLSLCERPLVPNLGIPVNVSTHFDRGVPTHSDFVDVSFEVRRHEGNLTRKVPFNHWVIETQEGPEVWNWLRSFFHTTLGSEGTHSDQDLWHPTLLPNTRRRRTRTPVGSRPVRDRHLRGERGPPRAGRNLDSVTSTRRKSLLSPQLPWVVRRKRFLPVWQRVTSFSTELTVLDDGDVTPIRPTCVVTVRSHWEIGRRTTGRVCNRKDKVVSLVQEACVGSSSDRTRGDSGRR